MIGNTRYPVIDAAYLFYYASDAAFDDENGGEAKLQARLKELIGDALIIANNVSSGYSAFRGRGRAHIGTRQSLMCLMRFR